MRDCVLLQQVRLVVDGCDVAGIEESDTVETSAEDRRACEAVSETPGEGRYLSSSSPLQLGGRSNSKIKYPQNVARDGFNGCIKNFVHNGKVLNSQSSSVFLAFLYLYSLYRNSGRGE